MKKLTATVLTVFTCIGVNAQNSTTASGGDASGSTGSSSYSVGQIVYLTDTATNGIVSQGVQQPFEIYVTTGILETEIKLSILVYPNPTSDFLSLEIGKTDFQELTYKLIDVQGKLLEQKSIISNTTSIELRLLPNSTYFIEVSNHLTPIKTFKIIKT
jgi:hypothetical protein